MAGRADDDVVMEHDAERLGSCRDFLGESDVLT